MWDGVCQMIETMEEIGNCTLRYIRSLATILLNLTSAGVERGLQDLETSDLRQEGNRLVQFFILQDKSLSTKWPKSPKVQQKQTGKAK